MDDQTQLAEALSRFDDYQGAEAVRFLYESAKSTGFREGEDSATTCHARRTAANNHEVAAAMLNSACDKGRDMEGRRELARFARMILSRTPMISPHMSGILDRLATCNLNDTTKMVPLGVLEAARDLAIMAWEDLR